jgi:hypothetical protein
MTYDRYLDSVRCEEFSLLSLEAHYRKETVCEPECIHSPLDALCSLRSSQRQDHRTTGKTHTP